MIRDRAVRAARRWFPEHQIYLRTNGNVRLLRVGTRVQAMAASAAALVALWIGVASVNLLIDISGKDELAAKQAELNRMEARVAAMRVGMVDLKGDVATAAEQLEQRQRFLASLLTGRKGMRELAEMMPSDAPVLADADSVAPSVLQPFAKLEREQLAFVDKATSAAEARYRDTNAVLRRLGLNRSRFVAQSHFAMGGPEESVDGSGSPLADAEPRFKELFLSWKRVEQLEDAMSAIPSRRPARGSGMSSGFGVRYDPFTGRAAMHAGIDITGNRGEPIYAAADGVVTDAGWNGAYGRAVDLRHGRGLATRYGHMSAVLVGVGERVKRGEIIGRMGSTGRSTGTHLHYEVRVDGRAVNPRPFLEAAPHVLAIQSRADRAQGGPEQPVAN